MPRTSNRQRVVEFVTSRGWQNLDEAEWDELRGAFPGVLERSLRTTLQQAGVRVEQPWAGVDSHTFDGLENSLTRLAEIYLEREGLRKYIRTLVIEAKDRTRGASKNPRVSVDKRSVKTEMVSWLLVWLDDPAFFASWVALRRRQNG